MDQPDRPATAENPQVDADESACSTSQCPACHLITYNVSKKHNLGTLARCATAFNVRQVCLVGSRQFNTFGAHGASEYVDFCHYSTLEECCHDLRHNKGCSIVGVEIVEGAQPVHSFPFSGSTAFMLGNEGQGLNEKQLALCDSFVYISQYGAGTASLNVAVAASIVLHHFALFAGYQERQRQGYKFEVAERPQRTAARGVVPLSPAELAAERQRRQQVSQDGDGDAAALPALFD
ncbi:hypothetical protein D9Q98_009691 [Chlorella vulgaris]|uniref:tRNA/rRNA methyltransferase SpoU type domain-containing protein n=1 Tax=Chlorella vulgaris TaxID=3077 RepID=A0A9D4TEV3_CHLVU|nr:hypothetical protein D9Q98_009691 [Chlorella vulgaris]